MPVYMRSLLKDPPNLLKNFHYEDVLSFLEMVMEERYNQGEIVVN